MTALPGRTVELFAGVEKKVVVSPAGAAAMPEIDALFRL